jgi:2-hydroxy-6-oxonona-2,4-dienedioate hydrolase
MAAATVSPAELWTTVGGLRVYARDYRGSGASGIPMILVHGTGVSGHYLMPTAEHLAPDFPTLVPDLPGNGRSDKPDHVLRITELADALAAWMESLELRDACLVGNSVGCQTLVDLALQHPHLVRYLVLVGATTDPEARWTFGQILRGTLDLFREPLRYWPRLTYDYLVTGPVRTVMTLHHAVNDPIAEKLPKVQAPTLVVRGSRDPIAPQRWAEQMVQLLPQGELHIIPGAAHAANYSAGEELAVAVRDFVGRQQSHGAT